jgi:MFS superfamily sulfate permease-like transporter
VVALGVTTADLGAYQAYAVALVLVIGAIFLVAGLARLGWVTQFLSKPVMDGFVTGLAIFVAVGQLNKLFGVEKGEGNVFQKLFTVIKELPQAMGDRCSGGIGCALFLLPRLNKKIPAGLVVLFGSIAASAAFNLNANYGVDVAGVLPQGLPSISLPQVSLGTVFAMILPAMGFLANTAKPGCCREFAGASL